MLIELEELKHKINNSKWYGTDAWKDILDMAADCETMNKAAMDSIEVVRCKDCMFSVAEKTIAVSREDSELHSTLQVISI